LCRPSQNVATESERNKNDDNDLDRDVNVASRTRSDDKDDDDDDSVELLRSDERSLASDKKNIAESAVTADKTDDEDSDDEDSKSSGRVLATLATFAVGDEDAGWRGSAGWHGDADDLDITAGASRSDDDKQAVVDTRLDHAATHMHSQSVVIIIVDVIYLFRGTSQCGHIISNSDEHKRSVPRWAQRRHNVHPFQAHSAWPSLRG